MSVQIKGVGTIGGLDEGLVISGIVTSSTQINVGSNIKLGNAGVVTATSFVGSGAQLTGITQTTINSNTNNYLITGTGTANTLQGEANLTFDGAELDLNNSGGSARLYLVSGNSADSSIYFGRQNDGATGGIRYEHTNDSLQFMGYNNSERLRIDSSGSLLIANTSGSRTNLSNNADDIVIGNTSTSNETGISMFSTSTSGIRFNDASGTDAAIEYSHSARELRFNSAGNNRLQFGINAFNSPVFSLGTGHYSGDSNNHNKGDRVSVKVGGYLHLESATGAGHNTRAGLGYNCYFHSLESFYCGTKSPSSGDNRPAAYGMAYGNHYFYSDASNTAHSAQAQLTMTKNMVIHRQGYVTKPNQPSCTLYAPHGGQQINVAGDNVPIGYSQVEHNTGMTVSNGGSSASTRVNSRIQVPVAGRYLVSSLMSGSLNSAAAVDANDGVVWYLRKNGGSYSSPYNNMFGWDTLGSTSGQEFDMNFTVVISLAANDYLEVAYTNIHTNFNVNLDKGYFSVHLLS